MKIFHGYLVLVATFTLNLVSFGMYTATALYLEPLQRSLSQHGTAELAFFSTLQVVVGLAASMGGGPVQDYLMLKGITMQTQFLLFGGGCLSLGLFWSSMAQSLSWLLVGAVFMGVGLGIAGFVSKGICVLWFNKNRGTMLLLSMSGRGLGSILFSIMTSHYLRVFEKAEEAWRPSMQLNGAICFVSCAIASLAMRLPDPGEVEENEGPAAPVQLTTPSPKLGEQSIIPSQKCSANASCNSGADGGSGYCNSSNEERNINQGNSTLSNSPPNEQTVLYALPPAQRSAAAQLFERRRRLHRGVSAVDPIELSPARRLALSTRSHKLRNVARHRPTSSDPAQLAPLAPLVDQYRAAILNNLNTSPKSPKFFVSANNVHGNNNDVEQQQQQQKQQTIRSAQGHEPSKTYASFREVALSRTSICLNVWTLITSFAYSNFQVHLPTYAHSVGLPPSAGGKALSIFGFGLLTANISLGPIADYVGGRNTMIVSMMGLAMLDFAWPYCHSVYNLYGVAALYGYLASTQGALPLIIMADAYRTAPSNHILMLNGILNVTMCPGFLFGPSIAGYLYQISGTYFSASVFSGVTFVMGNLFLFWIPKVDSLAGNDKDNDDTGGAIEGKLESKKKEIYSEKGIKNDEHIPLLNKPTSN